MGEKPTNIQITYFKSITHTYIIMYTKIMKQKREKTFSSQIKDF